MIWAMRIISPAAALPGYLHLVCYYAEKPYKLHYACVPCRVAFKRHSGPGEHRCLDARNRWSVPAMTSRAAAPGHQGMDRRGRGSQRRTAL